MTEMANADQHATWNGDSGRRWVAGADRRDRVLAPVADALFAQVAIEAGTNVLDIGCGCGATTLDAAARVGPAGHATGVDLSAPMLEVARSRATRRGAANVTFLEGDAQFVSLPPGSFDVAISRFGTMFFSDAHAAFANVARALRPGGRLGLATWQPLEANDWLTVPGAALLAHTDLPDAVEGPGMFAQSDPEIVTDTLARAGFVDIAVTPYTVAFTLGSTLDEALEHLADSGPGRVMLESIPEGPDRDAALADVRDSLVAHHSDAGVRLDGGIWLTTAKRA